MHCVQGDWGPAFGGRKRGSGGRGGGRKGSAAANKLLEPTEEELQAMAEEVEAEAMEDDGDGEFTLPDRLPCSCALLQREASTDINQLALPLLLQTRPLASGCSASCSTTHAWMRYAPFRRLLLPCCSHCCLAHPRPAAAAALTFSSRLPPHATCLPSRTSSQSAMRTEPLGLDRHCRRYWWLHNDPGFLFVEDADGQRIGVITSKRELDEVRGLRRLRRWQWLGLGGGRGGALSCGCGLLVSWQAGSTAVVFASPGTAAPLPAHCCCRCCRCRSCPA